MTSARLRTLVWCGAAALSVLAVAPSASARAAEPIGISADDAIVGVGSDGGRASLFVGAEDWSPSTLTDVTLKVDAAGLAGKATIEATNPNCKTDGTVVTCTEAALTLPTWPLHLTIVPAKGTVSGDRGTLAWSVTAAELPTLKTTSEVRFADSVDLANVPVGDGKLSGRPGSEIEFPLAVRNNSETTADGVILWSSTSTANVKYVRRGTNCLYTDELVACKIDQDLNPRTTYTLPASVAIDVRADAPAPYTYENSLEWTTLDDGQRWLDLLANNDGKRGTGPPLKLLERRTAAREQTDPDEGNNFASFQISITGSNKAEQAAVGGTFSGAVGSTVTADVGIRSTGPARADYDRENVYTLPGVHIVAPANTTVATADPKACVRAKNGERDEAEENPVGARELLCWGWTETGAIEVGDTLLWRIGFKLTAATGTAGKVSVLTDGFDREPTLDADRANNAAALTIAAAQASPPAGGGAGGGNGDDDGPSLPVTGAPAGTAAAGGLALIAIGVACVVAARRRTRFTD